VVAGVRLAAEVTGGFAAGGALSGAAVGGRAVVVVVAAVVVAAVVVVTSRSVFTAGRESSEPVKAMTPIVAPAMTSPREAAATNASRRPRRSPLPRPAW
jgi:flagellar basal body-associated protein FliL